MSGHYNQQNHASSGGIVNANQGSGPQIINYNAYDPTAERRRRRRSTWLVLSALIADVLYFFYGMWSYTGRNTPADTVRAVVYLFMLVITIRLIRNWFRRRF
ncbi:hypothetical protein [Dactylosporangium sp. CA-139066]|uniref:hypothetical protein n=1 Tax=Dactylosporangium sp. CA-139066 TaxID=3239930 RepID=UPI003D926D74